MTKQNQQLLIAAALVAATSVWSAAQAPQPATPPPAGQPAPAAGVPPQGRGAQGPPQPMSFFVTSRPDRQGGEPWRARGSGRPLPGAGDGRRRRQSHVARHEHAGAERGQCAGPHRRGPLVQRQGPADRAEPGGAPRRHAGPRPARKLGHPRDRDERKGRTNQRGRAQRPNQHDMLTGSQPDGRASRTPPITLQQLDERGGHWKRTARDITTGARRQ